ncbi:hypothetical protein SAMN05444397_105339 [Flavobacterium aquidurense]|uniref:Uncharacterized protein n=1 Tax=Flavobacterium frigidimaris TaxID=262320 RepID=A0ABX4BWC8_FLAFR|nr:hypothetical protein [Flavobacterium frigidimaris]OXA81820.1 hypothetical protein B0A65_01970 [Flavobacterium frigidimaris]SDZ35350.1 hypothetical protein SAMN05444397_105339 [Flavobacterium aquidurense]
MDFDDIQNAWKNEETKNVVLPNNLEKIQSVNMPLDKIRKNLKKDLIAQIVSVVFVGIVPLIIELKYSFFLAYYLLYALSIVILISFTIRLYVYYKNFTDVATTTKDNLYEIYYNIKLFMETYKSATYTFIPFGLFYMFLLPLGKKSGKLLNRILDANQENVALIVVLIIVVFMTLMWLMTEGHVKLFYGKYAKEIKKVIDELKEE